jgi:hypothetical protein
MNTKNLLVLLLLSIFSVSVFAGQSAPVPLTITVNEDGSGFAGGDMRTARNSKNDIESIGCGTRIYDDGNGGTWSWAFCQATDADGVFAQCFTQNPGLAAALDSVSDSSYLTFNWVADGEGGYECTKIGASTQSFYLAPTGKK